MNVIHLHANVFSCAACISSWWTQCGMTKSQTTANKPVTHVTKAARLDRVTRRHSALPDHLPGIGFAWCRVWNTGRAFTRQAQEANGQHLEQSLPYIPG